MTYRNQSSINDPASYGMSGLPYATASTITAANGTVKITFPFVTKFIAIRNTTASSLLRVGFTANGVSGSNYLTIDTTTPFQADMRVRELYLRQQTGATINYQVIAGLTTINSSVFPNLTSSVNTGSNNFEYFYPGVG